MQPVKTSGFRTRLSHAGGALASPETSSRPIKSKSKNARLASMLQRVSSVKTPTISRRRNGQKASPSSSDTFAGKSRNSAGKFDDLQDERLAKDFILMSRNDSGTISEENQSSLKRSFDTMLAMSRRTPKCSPMRSLPSWLSHACGSLSPGHPLRKFGPPTPPFTDPPDTLRGADHYRNDNSKEAWRNCTEAHQELIATPVPRFSGSHPRQPVEKSVNTPSVALSFPMSGSHPHHATFPALSLPGVPDYDCCVPYPPTRLSASRSSLPAPLSPGTVAFYSNADKNPTLHPTRQANLYTHTVDALQTKSDLIMSSPLKGENVLPASPVIHSSVEIIHPSTRKVGKFNGFASTSPLPSMSPIPTMPITPITHLSHPATNNIYSNQLLDEPSFELSPVQDDAVSVALRANQSFFAPIIGVAFPLSPNRLRRINPAPRSPMDSCRERAGHVGLNSIPTDIPASFKERSESSVPFTYHNPNLATPSTSTFEHFSCSSPSPFSIDLPRHRLRKKSDMYSDRLLDYASYAAEDVPIPSLIFGFGLGSEAKSRRSPKSGTADPEEDTKRDQGTITLRGDPDLDIEVQPRRLNPVEPIWELYDVPKESARFRLGQTQDKYPYSHSPSKNTLCTPVLQGIHRGANHGSARASDHTIEPNISAERLSNQRNSTHRDEIEENPLVEAVRIPIINLQQDEYLSISSSPSSIDSWTNEDVLSYLKGEKQCSSK